MDPTTTILPQNKEKVCSSQTFPNSIFPLENLVIQAINLGVHAWFLQKYTQVKVCLKETAKQMKESINSYS